MLMLKQMENYRKNIAVCVNKSNGNYRKNITNFHHELMKDLGAF